MALLEGAFLAVEKSLALLLRRNDNLAVLYYVTIYYGGEMASTK